MIRACACPSARSAIAYRTTVRPSFGGLPSTPTLTTSDPSMRRAQGRPECVHMIRSAPLAATRRPCSASGSDSHQKSFSPMVEPCTKCTSQPPIRSRRSAGSRPIQAANAVLVRASV